MEDHGMSARQKGDIYWKKRKRYLAAAAARNGLKEGYLNHDMAVDVLDRYEALKAVKERIIITGNEFSERPPTAVVRRAFADSVAALMHERDRYKHILETMDEDEIRSEDKIMADRMEENLGLIEHVIDDFFMASGTTQEGEKISDKDVRKKGNAAFKKSSEEFSDRISKSYREIGVRYIEEIREKNGLKELMDAPDPGAGPVFTLITDKYADAAAKNKDVIERLKQANTAARHKSAQLMAGVEAIRGKVSQEYFDAGSDAMRRFLLERTFDEYSSRIDEQLSELLKIQEASVFCAAWVLASLPMDPILKPYIDAGWGCEPDYIDGSMRLNELPGFIFLKEYERRDSLGELKKLEDIKRVGEKLKAYLYTHPWQFDGQCLMSICRGTEDLPAIVADAKHVRDTVDMLTEQTDFADKLGLEERIELYNIWVMSDLISRVGYMLTEFLTAHENATVSESEEDLKKLLPEMSYSKLGRLCREAVKRLMRERVDSDV